MASTASSYHPTRDDFAAMIDEYFARNLQESTVIKARSVAIEKTWPSSSRPEDRGPRGPA